MTSKLTAKFIAVVARKIVGVIYYSSLQYNLIVLSNNILERTKIRLVIFNI